MRKILVLVLLGYAKLAQGTSLTGALNNPSGAGASGVLILSLSQQAALLAGCGGPAIVDPSFRFRITVTGGALQGSPSVYGNDCMLPANTYYKVQFTDSSGNILFTDNWVITGSSLNIGTIVSATLNGTTTTLGSTGFVVLVPATNQIVNQPVGTHLGVNTFNVTGTLTMPDGSTCTSSGCSVTGNSVLLTGPQTISGIKTFSNGAVATVFNCTVTTAADCVTQQSATFHITGQGDGYFQTLNAHVGVFTHPSGDSFEAINVAAGFVYSHGGFATDSTSIAAINANGGTIQGKYLTVLNSLLFGATGSPAPAVAGQAEIYLNSSFQLLACVYCCPSVPVNLVTTGGGSGSGAGNNPLFNTLAVGTAGQLAVDSLGNLATQGNVNLNGIVNSAGGFMTSTGSFYVCASAGIPVGGCVRAGSVGMDDFNVGSHGSTTAITGNGAAISNTAGSIALFTYDTVGVCGIGAGEPAPGISCSSDARLKHNREPLGSSLAAIRSLQPVTFDWNTTNEHGVGFIAQEVQKVLPNLVTENQGYLMLSDTGMIPYLVKAVQEQQGEIERLRSRLDAMSMLGVKGAR